MKLQNFRFVFALVALLPCLIEGRPQQDYLNGILFEAPADVPNSDSAGKLSLEELLNNILPILEFLPDDLPLSILKDPNEFKKFLETELLYDAPEDVLYDNKAIASKIHEAVEAGLGISLLKNVFGFFSSDPVEGIAKSVQKLFK